MWNVEAIRAKEPLDRWTDYKLVVYLECQRCQERLYAASLTTEHLMCCAGFGKLFASPLPPNDPEPLRMMYPIALAVNIESLRNRDFMPFFVVYKQSPSQQY